MADVSCVHGLAPCGPSALLATKTASLKKDISFGNPLIAGYNTGIQHANSKFQISRFWTCFRFVVIWDCGYLRFVAKKCPANFRKPDSGFFEICGALVGHKPQIMTISNNHKSETCSKFRNLEFGVGVFHPSNIADFSKTSFFVFFYFYRSKSGVLGQKRCFGVFWTECEVPKTKTESNLNGP